MKKPFLYKWPCCSDSQMAGIMTPESLYLCAEQLWYLWEVIVQCTVFIIIIIAMIIIATAVYRFVSLMWMSVVFEKWMYCEKKKKVTWFVYSAQDLPRIYFCKRICW